MALLEIRGLHVEVDGKRVLKGVNLKVERGEVYVIMGPNGSGKTSLAMAIMGHPSYKVVEGDIVFKGESIASLPVEERGLRGIFLGFQNPVEVPGVRLSTLVIASYNKRRGLEDLTKPSDPRLLQRMMRVAEDVGLAREHLYREVNIGFSGGERKRAEILQLLLLEPELTILDEPDSGLDVDGVWMVAKIIDALRKKGRSVLLITHYARVLSYVKPDKVAVLVDGRIVDRGGAELAEIVEREGYSRYLEGE